MRHPRVLSLLTLLLCSGFVGAQSSSTELIVRAMRSLGFSTLYSEARSDGTLLGLPADEAGRLVFAPETGLTIAERDAVLLALLLGNRHDPGVRARLRAALFSRIESLSDWSLLAELLSPPATDILGATTLRRVHLELARRVLLALETSTGGGDAAVAGYEPVAIALANSALANTSRANSSPPSDPDTEAISLASSLVLAETFREIARLSRNPDAVEALNRAARELLTN